MALTKTPIELSSTPSIVDGGNATAITIDSSENVLVGKTDTSIGVAGSRFISNGQVQATASGQEVLLLNRLSSDGELLNFRKDSTTVGQINSRSSDMVIGTGDTGLQFYDAGNSIFPLSASGNTNRDAVIDLGETSNRFKDLYLSGGAYLGGTAAANKLDHYEDVAWTPTQSGVTLSVTKARALRVGNLVTLNARIDWPSNSDSTTIALGGLPFPYVSTWEGTGSIMAYNAVLDGDRTQLNTYLGGSSINFYKTGSGVQWVALNNTALSGAEVIFTVSYLTS